MAENKKVGEILMKHLRGDYFWLNLTTLAAQFWLRSWFPEEKEKEKEIVTPQVAV